MHHHRYISHLFFYMFRRFFFFFWEGYVKRGFFFLFCSHYWNQIKEYRFYNILHFFMYMHKSCMQIKKYFNRKIEIHIIRQGNYITLFLSYIILIHPNIIKRLFFHFYTNFDFFFLWFKSVSDILKLWGHLKK